MIRVYEVNVENKTFQEPDSFVFLPDDSGHVAQFGESGIRIFSTK
jgi:hypothetical protein